MFMWSRRTYKYRIKGKYSWLTDTFLKNEIAPNVCKLTNENIAITLSKPLIYAALQPNCESDNTFELIPPILRKRILLKILNAGKFISQNEIP